MLNITTLLSCIRPNFCIDKSTDKPYQTNEILEGSKSSAIVMMIGISSIYNIDKKEMMADLCITYDEYRHKLNMFHELCEAAREKIKTKTLNVNKNYDKVDRFYNKLVMVQNAIRLLFRNQYVQNAVILEEYE